MAIVVNEQIQTVTTFSRANEITIHNPLPSEGAPSIHFKEFTISQDEEGNEKVLKQNRFLSEAFTAENSEEEFDMIHPESGEAIGLASYGQLQAMVYSLYFHLYNKEELRLEEIRLAALEEAEE